MGIERFFSSLNRNFDVVNDLRKPYQKIDATHFYIDFNSIIHNVSSRMIIQINQFKQKKIDKLDFEMKNIEDFERILIMEVKKEVQNMLSNNFVSGNIEHIMIAIDGVPSFAKMIEQRKRRYIGDLLSQLMKKFELPFEWSKNNISPGTKFMDIMSKSLKEKSFLEECKKICFKLKNILISDIYNPGEGEMKIIDCLKELTDIKNNKICVYSPDSDMILLLMILKIPVLLLRHDQQKSQKENESVFNLIEVQKFKKQLLNYCKKRIDNQKMEISDQELIDEIVYIFTLFGDDFIPKTESINVSDDINIIMESYLKTLNDKGKILISKNNIYSINFTQLYYFFGLLAKTELNDLNRYFYDSKFKNYKFAKDKNFHYDLFKFKQEVNKLILQFIAKNGKEGDDLTIENASKKFSLEDFTKFLFSDNFDDKFDYNSKIFKLIGKKHNDLNRNILNYLFSEIKKSEHLKEPFYNFFYNIRKVLDTYELRSSLNKNKVDKESPDDKKLYFNLISYMFINPNQFPFINFRHDSNYEYERFFERSFDKKDHINKMKKLNLFREGKEKDQFEYIIQNKLDDYQYLFNPVNFFYKTKVTSTNKYYEIMFPNVKKEDVIKKYIEGFQWVLNYYFNRKTDYLWHYPYSRTPLLSDVINVLEEKTIDLNFDEKRMFNPLEAIIFITPIDVTTNLDFFPKEIDSKLISKIYTFIEKNKYFFLNLKDIYTILNSNPKGLDDLLDCSVSIFLSKCHYKSLEKETNPELFIKKFREEIPKDKQMMFNNFDLICEKLN